MLKEKITIIESFVLAYVSSCFVYVYVYMYTIVQVISA